jgi:hypothetical protein
MNFAQLVELDGRTKQSRQDAAPTGFARPLQERHVYMDVLMSWSARMRVSDAAAIFRDSADLMLVMSLWYSSA